MASYTSIMRPNRSILIFLALLILSACDLIQSNETEPTVTLPAVEVSVETPNPTPHLQSTPDIVAPTITTATAPSLTIWIPPDTLLGTEAGTAEFSNQLLAFNNNHPELETRVEQKPVSGQGGILSYLRTGVNVAPDILPDLVILPTNQLAAAASEGLIYPLDNLLDPADIEDLYPAARTMVQVEEQTLGYPFAITNLSHLAYQTNVITTTPPLRWSDFIKIEKANFIFPAAGSEGASLALEIYLAGGGTLFNDANQLTLDALPLTQALEQLNQGRSTGFILLQSSNVDTLEESWEAFQAGTAVFALTNADQFLAKRTSEFSPGYSVIAGPDGPLTPLIDGWAWAITTADPTRRAVAVELLASLISGPNLGEWSRQSNRLPARRQAFVVWPGDDPYINFVQLELERAQPNPVGTSGQLIEALKNAVFDVISLSKTPQEAADIAESTLLP